MSFTRSCASDGFWLLHGQVADNQMFEFRNRKNKRPEDVMVEGLFLFVGLQKLWQYKKLAESCAVGIQLPAVSCAMTTTMVGTRCLGIQPTPELPRRKHALVGALPVRAGSNWCVTCKQTQIINAKIAAVSYDDHRPTTWGL